MKLNKQLFILTLFTFVIIFFRFSNAQIKPFKRALIIAGGGIQPGLSLGYIAAAEKMGWKPDVIIATCGASIPSAIYNKFDNAETSLAYIKSSIFFNTLHKVQIDNPNLLSIQKKFKNLARYPDLIPDFFNNNVLYIPESLNSELNNDYFQNTQTKPKLIIITARAHFGNNDVGKQKGNLLRFTEVLMTDPETAKHFNNYEPPVNNKFLNSTIDRKLDLMTQVPLEFAMRASISDPFLVNPAVIHGEYYFTGAADLYPVDIANFLAEEVVSTYPFSLFTDYENLAIKSTFGISQSQRVLYAIQDPKIKWIDQSLPPKDMSFDPTAEFLMLKNEIPDDLYTYQIKVQQQYDFGYSRMKELLSLKQNKGPFTHHLREPINPALFKKFTCDNANVWKTNQRSLCYVDTTKGCNRKSVQTCTPIR